MQKMTNQNQNFEPGGNLQIIYPIFAFYRRENGSCETSRGRTTTPTNLVHGSAAPENQLDYGEVGDAGDYEHGWHGVFSSSDQFSLVAQSCLTLRDPVDCRTSASPCPSPFPGIFSNSCPSSQWCQQTISSSSSPSPPAFNLSEHPGLFQWVSSLHQVAKVLELQLQHHSFQWTFRTDFPQDWLVWTPWSPRDSQEPSPTPQFKSINSSECQRIDKAG